MFYVVEWPLQLIICILNVLNINFAEVDEVMFQRVERPCEIRLCILGIEKETYATTLKSRFKLANGSLNTQSAI
jgi:hypothetical protein